MNKVNQKGFAHIELILIAIVIFGITGVGFYVFKQRSNDSSNSETTDNSIVNQEALGSLDQVKSVDEIKSISEAELNGASIVSIELENENGTMFYRVKLSDDRVLYFNATNGEKIAKPSDNSEDDSDDESVALSNAKISIAEAKQIAQNRLPGKTIIKIELENEEGVLVYSVRFADSGRVDVNANTGSIVRVEESEDRSDEDNEDENDDDSDEEGDSDNDSDDDSDDDEDEPEDN